MSTTPPTTNSQLDSARIRDWILGGAAVGGGAGVLTSLLNHYKSLNERAQRQNDTTWDDDVLYVNLPHRTPARDKSATTLGTVEALLGGAGAGLGSYALVHKLYQRHKNKVLQEELDKAQNAYLDKLVPSEKLAATSAPVSGWEAVKAGPIALLLTSALGAGVLTDKLLEKNFPGPKKPMGLRPKRLVVRDTPIPEDEEMIKEQSACAHMLRTVLALPEAEQHSGLGDLVKAASEGRIGEILAASDEGPAALFETVKGAKGASEGWRRDLAIGWLLSDPELSAGVKLAAALEFQHAFPGICKLARLIPESWHADLIGIAADSHRMELCSRYESTVDATRAQASKSALELGSALRSALEFSGPDESMDAGIEAGEGEDSERTAITPLGPAATKTVNDHKDAIDAIFAPAKPETKL